MAAEKQLGIFLNDDYLYCAESSQSLTEKFFRIPWKSSASGTAEGGGYIPALMQLSIALQNALKDHHIQVPKVNISLPIKDIIFRSFVIPWMPVNEIRAAVEFEAVKYIPFALNELSYSYTSKVVTEEGIKRHSIIFVAIKRDTFNEYSEILQQVGLEVNVSEPAAFSIIRILKLKNLLQADQTIALIEKEDDRGKITILQNELPQFVREFPLTQSTGSEGGAPAKDNVLKRFITEIRISLDYFNRHTAAMEINQLVFFGKGPDKEVVQVLKTSFELPLVHVKVEDITQNTKFNEIGYVVALGASIINPKGQSPVVDLTPHKPKESETTATRLEFNFKNLKYVLLVSILCMPCVIMAYFFSRKTLNNPLSRIEILKGQLKEKAEIAIASLKEREEALKEKAENYKKIRLNSQITGFLATVPGLLPQGTWLERMDIVYDDKPIRMSVKGAKSKKTKKKKVVEEADSKILLSFSGYVYSDNPKAQIRIVNNFLKDIKKNPQFAEYFKTIDLDSVKSLKQDKFVITYFQVSCK